MVIREIIKVLAAFYHRVAQLIKVMKAKRGAGVEWEYPAVEESMYSARIHPIGVYIKRQKATIAERAAFRLVYALRTEADMMPETIWMVH